MEVDKFRFLPRNRRINLPSVLASVDIERTASSGNVSDLQAAINELTFCDLNEDDFRTLAVGSNAAQLVRIFQLGIEYVVHIQNVLRQQQEIDRRSIQKLSADKAALLKENADLKQKNEYLKNKLIEYAKRLKASKKFLCPYCPNTYTAAEQLAGHLDRRHAKISPSGPAIDEDRLLARISEIAAEATRTINGNVDESRIQVVKSMNAWMKPILDNISTVHGTVEGGHRDLSDKAIDGKRTTSNARDEIVDRLDKILNRLNVPAPPPPPPPQQVIQPPPPKKEDPIEERKYSWFPKFPYLLAAHPRCPMPVNELSNALANVATKTDEATLAKIGRLVKSEYMTKDHMRSIVDEIVTVHGPQSHQPQPQPQPQPLVRTNDLAGFEGTYYGQTTSSTSNPRDPYNPTVPR